MRGKLKSGRSIYLPHKHMDGIIYICTDDGRTRTRARASKDILHTVPVCVCAGSSIWYRKGQSTTSTAAPPYIVSHSRPRSPANPTHCDCDCGCGCDHDHDCDCDCDCDYRYDLYDACAPAPAPAPAPAAYLTRLMA